MSYYFTLAYYFIQISSSTESALNNQSVCVDKEENFEEIKEKHNPLQEKISNKEEKQRCSSDNSSEDTTPNSEGKEEDPSFDFNYFYLSRKDQQLYDNEMSNRIFLASLLGKAADFSHQKEIRSILFSPPFTLKNARQRMEKRNDLQLKKSKVTQFNYAIQYLFEKIRMILYIFYNFLFSPKQEEILNEKTEELRKNQ